MPAPTGRPLRVFVSSTWIDNQRRRQIVEQAILRAGMTPVGMERMNPDDRTATELSLDELRACDVLLGILAHRYGTIPEGHEVSITELEHDAAKAAGLRRMVFVIDERLPIDKDRDFDRGDDWWQKQGKLDAFKKRLAGELTLSPFQEDDLGMKALDALSSLYGGETPAGVRLEAELEHYRAKAIPLHRWIQLVGFPQTIKVPISLEELYVPLVAVVDRMGVDPGDLADAEHAKQAIEGPQQTHGLDPVDLAGSFPAAARWGDRRGVLLLGDPGSGKTTQLRRMLLAVARDGPGAVGLPDGVVPVYLPLRNLARLDQGFDAFIQSELSDPHLDTSEGFGQRLVDRGGVLYLLDGLDEVADEQQRARVAHWIDTALRTQEDCYFLVSCRYAGYTRRVRERLSGHFLPLHLRPMDAAQAEQFVHSWYTIVETAVGEDPVQARITAKDKATRLVQRLQEPDFRARRVFELTRNPLLLTGICLVHRHRGTLPRHRHQLYSDCVESLLERWRDAKNLEVTIPADDARAVLEPVAYWLHQQEGRRQASADELTPVIDAALRRVGQGSRSAREFLRSIRDESGLLTGWSGETYGLMHLGFQEYLAARELRRRGLHDAGVFATLAERFGEGWWQEVILLMLALPDEPPVFEAFMREVVQHPGFALHDELVDMCLDDARVVSTRPFVEIVRQQVTRPWWQRLLGQDTVDAELVERQLAALRVLGRIAPEQVRELADGLRGHRDERVRQWSERWERSGDRSRVNVADRGGYELVRIPAGSFMMGSPDDEEDREDDEGPQHLVKLARFELGRYPVTNAEYGEFLKDNPGVEEPREWGNRQYNQPRQPVVGVSWDEAMAYCEWAGLTLPTEAQWEYACRAGSTTRYSSGDSEADLARVGWYRENSGGRPHPVGEKEPNDWGLYDMHGNVWEWCLDAWGSYEGRAPRASDGLRNRPVSVANLVERGGCFVSSAHRARSAYRFGWPPTRLSSYLSFRAARVSTK